MSDLFVTARSTGQSTRAGSPVILSGTVSNPPRAFDNLSPGDFLRGHIIGQDDKGRLLIQTNIGQLKVAAPSPLPPGTEVALEVRQAGARVQIYILQGAGTPQPSQHVADSHSPIPAKDLLTRPAFPDIITQGPPVKAIIQAPFATGLRSLHLEQAGRIPSGAELQVRVLAVAQPHQGSFAKTNEGLLAGQSARSSDTPASYRDLPDSRTTGQAFAAGLRTSGNALALSKLHKLAPLDSNQRHHTLATHDARQRPNPALSSPLAQALPDNAPGFTEKPSEALKITGQVTGRTGLGQPILRTPIGIITLQIQSPIPNGSSLLLELPHGQFQQLPPFEHKTLPTSGGLASSPGEAREGTSNPRELASLQLDTIKLPVAEIGRNFSATLLLLLGFLKGGRTANWIAERSRTGDFKLPPGESAVARPEFVHGPEASALSRPIETASGDWRLYLLPFLYHGAQDYLRFYLRRRPPGPKKPGPGAREKAKRFIIEGTLSQLGAIQLDGLVTKSRFELVFRSDSPLPGELKRGMISLFEKGLALEGWRGRLLFQRLAKTHTRLADAKNRTDGVTIV